MSKMPSIINKWKAFGNTRTLSGAGHLHPTSLSNWDSKVLVMENKNLMVTVTKLQYCSVESLAVGQPFLQHSYSQSCIVEWPDGSHYSVTCL